MDLVKKTVGIAIAGLLIAGFAGGASAKPQKVDVCHMTGNGTYQLINVSENAVPAHQAHGDVVAGTGGLDEECNEVVVTPTRSSSGQMVFGPNGWGGWSCPTGQTAVSGGYEPSTATVQTAELAEPGDVYPHYTFGPDESGFVVQNDNDSETISVYVDCVPSE